MKNIIQQFSALVEDDPKVYIFSLFQFLILLIEIF